MHKDLGAANLQSHVKVDRGVWGGFASPNHFFGAGSSGIAVEPAPRIYPARVADPRAPNFDAALSKLDMPFKLEQLYGLDVLVLRASLPLYYLLG